MRLVGVDYRRGRKTLHKESCILLHRKNKLAKHRPIERGEDITEFRPCKRCFPDAPQISLLKRYCSVCGTNRACPHNGGVLIQQKLSNQHGEYVRPRWVWPDSPLARNVVA